MANHIYILFSFTASTTISLFLLTTLPRYHCHEEENKYTVCSRPFNCGRISDISYPFWGQDRPSYCGGSGQFELHCDANQTTSLEVGSQNFRVLKIDPHASHVTMVRTDLVYDNCSSDLTNTSLSSLFSFEKRSLKSILIVYDCTIDPFLFQLVQRDYSVYRNFSCKSDNNRTTIFYVNAEEYYGEVDRNLWGNCYHMIEVQTNKQGVADLEVAVGINGLKQALAGGFVVSYFTPYGQDCLRCHDSKGECGINDMHQFTCHCPDGSYALDCYGHSAPRGNSLSRAKNIIIGAVSASVGVLLLICIIICCSKHKSSWRMKEWFMPKRDLDIETFLKNHEALELKRYRYSDIKKMTNSFEVKLGQGGFGAVYKGKLLNGDPVAVKMLSASKGNGEEFINEVVSIRKTSHVNVVALLGFCLEGHKKALIYEFMANGSLEKFIYKKGLETTPSLSWENLYNIAIGIARGLEYLHRGCNTQILHFDIKPHNILLDGNFCPKISDFGLSKLCTKKESIISMSDARGTMGYVAPEVWNRHLGGVSHKSDVYSYGIMLLEMVGGMKDVNAVASPTSEIYFPYWAYNRLELGTHSELERVVDVEEEEEITKRMVVVGLWCVQTIPNDRPSMSKVIEMLKGSMNLLKMPPKPILSSPIISTPESSTSAN